MSSQPRSIRSIWALFALVAALVVGLDLWTKHAVFELLQVESVGDPPRVAHQVERPIIEGFFDLQANYNYGAFSGWFSRHTGILAILSSVALVVLAVFLAVQLRGGSRPPMALVVAIALVWGGTLGNLYDRALLGAVRDFVKWYVVWGGRERVWPNFNIADSAICCGVGLWILVEVLVLPKARERGGRSTSTPDG